MRIGIWGDSIGAGEGDPEGKGWVGRIQDAIPADSGATLKNFSVSGDISTDVLARFPAEAEAFKPDVVVFAVGINDARQQEGANGPQVPLAEFQSNIHKLVEAAQAHTVRVFIVGLTKIDEETKDAGKRTNARTDEYDKALFDFAREERVAYIHVFDTLDPKTNLADGLHPNVAGYQKLFSAIAPRVMLAAELEPPLPSDARPLH